MSKLVIFKFSSRGSFEQGFSVTAQIWSDGKLDSEIDGELPPAPDIVQHYQGCRDIYLKLGYSLRCLPFRVLQAPAAQVTNYSIADCSKAADALLDRLNNWLDTQSFSSLKEEVLSSLDKNDKVRVFIQSRDIQLRRLPWHECKFFKKRILNKCPDADIALSVEHRQQAASSSQRFVKILAILGGSTGIDTTIDETLLTKYAKPIVLKTPQRQEINDILWEEGWSILFFAGHSETQYNSEGRFYINETEYLTIDSLKYALKRAVKNGLKLAIFNSCDGLGLAEALADLHIPYAIVMREPVPDKVAHEFLQHFLRAFITESKPLDVAVQQARERLQGLEGQYPYASWFPIICQHPYEKPLTWRDLSHNPIISPKKLLIAGVAIATLSIAIKPIIDNTKNHIVQETKDTSGIQKPGFSEKPGFSNGGFSSGVFSSGEAILVKSLTSPDKQAGVQAFARGDFDEAEKNFSASLSAHPNDPEALIYRNNAKIGNRKAGKIAVSVPISSNLNVAQEILRGVAQAQDEFNSQSGSDGPLLKVALADDNNDPELAKQIAAEFVKSPDILAVVGHNASDVSVAAAQVYQGKLVMISPTSFAKSLSEVHGEDEKGNYIFRTVPSIDFVANSLADYVIKTARKTKIVMCYDAKAVDNQSFKNQFISAIDSRGVNPMPINCNFSASGFNPRAVIEQARKAQADSLVFAPHVDRIDRVVEMARANKGQLAMFGSPTLCTSQTLESPQDVNGLVLAVPWYPTEVQSNGFAKKASQLWQAPVNCWRTPMAYDATLAIIKGLQESDGTRDGLQKFLSNGFSVQGATGTVKLLPSGDRNGKGILVQVQQVNGGYDFVPLESVPTADLDAHRKKNGSVGATAQRERDWDWERVVEELVIYPVEETALYGIYLP